MQIILCGLYLYTGWAKLAMAPGLLHGGGSLFFPFLGLCELLGALGLILPSALRIAPGLTPVAAGGLAIIMVGAIHALAVGGQTAMLWLPIAALVGDLLVILGRGWWMPIRAH
ncbi:MAG TPA: DoxX family protein [Terriglobales bacterium]|nr:DoxX family protein [Terriglobales bacterium]